MATIGAAYVDIASTDTFDICSSTNYMPSFDWTLPSVQGTNRVYARYRDLAGNSCGTSAWIILDTLPPVSPSVAIDGGVSTTTNPVVTLTLSASDPYLSRMMVGDDEWFTGAQWTSYVATFQWTLPEPMGETKTVYAKFSDAVGWQSETASNSILYVPEPGVLLALAAIGIVRRRS